MAFNLFKPSTWFNVHEYFDVRYRYQFWCDTNVLEYNPFAFYSSNPIVFMAIDERAKAISNFKFLIEVKPPENGSPGEYITDHPLIDFLEKPNPYQSRQDFIKSLITFYSIYGPGYIYANKNVGINDYERQSLLVLDNEFLQIKENVNWIYGLLSQPKNKGQVDEQNQPKLKYVNPKNRQKDWTLDFDKLLPIFDTTLTTSSLICESRLKSLIYPISNIQTAFESKNTLLSNPGGIGIVSSDTSDANGRISLTPAEHEQMERDMNTKNGTRFGMNALRLSRTPIKYQATAPKIRDLMLDEGIMKDALVIFGQFGLPKELYAALAEGSTFENQKEAFRRYIQGDGQVIADNIASTLNSFFKPKEGRLIATCSHLPIMQENEKERVEIDKVKTETYKLKKEILDDLLAREQITLQYYREQLNLNNV